MSESEMNEPTEGDTNSALANEADLPPVKPPSAGFIFQLFLVPALIVLAVIAVWALFGRIAGGDQDWQTLVKELSHENYHRRWRGATGLAEILRADESRGEGGQQLSRNPQVASSLTDLLSEQLKSNSTREDDIKQAAFVARTLGLLDVHTTTFPILREATDNKYDREIRKNSLASIAMVLGRADEKQTPLSVDSDTETVVIALSSDEDSLVRHLATYTLGLMPSPASNRQLEVLMNNSDKNTRINALIALARNKSKAGLPLIKQILEEALEPLPEPANLTEDDTVEKKRAMQSAVEYEHNVAIRNVMLAIESLADELTPAERSELLELLLPIENDFPEPKNRTEAQRIRNLLSQKSAAAP